MKAAGIFWLCWRPRSRNHPHRRLQGLWAPASAIRAAEERAEQTAAKRALIRAQSERSRARHEQRYQDELRVAVLRFLEFSPTHAGLAEQTAAHAAVVGSGRVGRTQLLSLEQKAELAARAHIRHRYTSYHHEFDQIPIEAWDEDDVYREVKGAAHYAVDDFLDEHRSMPPQPPVG